MMDMQAFWKGKKVLITGHTGFKGSWLSLWLQQLGADVSGYSLIPESTLNLFNLADIGSRMQSFYGDIRDYNRLKSVMEEVTPEIIFHMAAQPLVRLSYEDPAYTFSTNIMGTVNVLEAARHTTTVQVIINVTSDKCYENPDKFLNAFVETDPLGGTDPYSASKGGAEIVANSYLKSFYLAGSINMASVRAGNVIGGGDWSKDRIIPDLIRAAVTKESLNIRYPNAVRPWQHVLDCLHGYLSLAHRLGSAGKDYVGAWNFGPDEKFVLSVSDMIQQATAFLDAPVSLVYETSPQPYEAKCLMLNSDKAKYSLEWTAKLPVTEAIQWTMEWYSQYLMQADMRKITLQQIKRFEDKELSVNV